MEVAKIVAPMVGALINTLGSAIWAELGTVWGVRDDIERLQRLLLTISAVLEDAERRSISDGALRRWLKDLKDAALDAEDVLGEFQIETLHKDKKGKVCVFFSSCDSIAFHYKMAGKVKGILKRFDEIAEDKAKFHLVDITTAVASVSHQERETFSSVDEDEIFGRSDDKEKVMEWLTEVDNDRNVSVLSIVGLGGVGKTTLAKLVYNDKKIKKHFKIRMWVCVGEKFDVNGIMKAILECATREKCKFSRLQDMQQRFQEKLENKRYLLILDDVWNNDASQWEALKLLVRGRTHGNKIVVTTRNQEVAVITSTMVSPHKLEVLSDDDCWMLFKQKAFGQGRREQSSNLVQIGKEVVGKCEGLPLAAKALGSLMATKRTEAEWFAIRNSDIWKLERGTKEILPALQLSDDHLPPQLKQCFIYCSIFPKDYLMKRLELIQLWIAQAFIQPKEGMQLEDIGNQYFNSLLGRAFFHNEEKDDFGNIVSCQMHDLVHALACFVAQDESSIVQIDENIIFPPGCRYSTVICHVAHRRQFCRLQANPKSYDHSFFYLGLITGLKILKVI